MSGQVTLVAALDRNFAIGRDNALPWRLPDDLKRFKALTLGKTVLMGRKSAESLGRALPQRRNLVLTRSGRVPFEGMQPVATMGEALEQCAGEELMVIGGGEIYALALPMAQRMHLTHVDTVVVEGDAFFPRFDSAEWHIIGRQPHATDARHACAFEYIDYQRHDARG